MDLNKPGLQKQIRNNINLYHKTFIYNIKKYYSMIPRTITLIPNQFLFSKWLKIYMLNSKPLNKIKIYPDHTTINPLPPAQHDQCLPFI